MVFQGLLGLFTLILMVFDCLPLFVIKVGCEQEDFFWLGDDFFGDFTYFRL